MAIPREEVINRLRRAGFTFNRRAPRVELWRKKGAVIFVDVPLRDFLSETSVRAILFQAKLTVAEVNEFLKAATKKEC